MRHHKTAQSIVAAISSLALVLGMGMFAPVAALGDDAQEQELSSAAAFEAASQDYLAAEEELQGIEQQIADNETRQAELEEKLPLQRSRTAASVKAMYLFQQSTSGLIDLVLSAENFSDFIATVRYLDVIQQRNNAEIKALVDLEDELAQTEAQLLAQRDAATQKRDEADAAMQRAGEALRDARAAQRILQANGDLAAEEAAAMQENPAAASAGEESHEAEQGGQQAQDSSEQTSAPSQQEQGSEQQSSSQSTQQEEAPAEQSETQPTPAAPSETSQTSSSTEDWAARIDAYLEGTELEGHGADFAAAAEQYGVDPRISPAISRIESGSGQVCFKPHNAWGWGTASWDDWTSAIYGHVSGFSEGYGSTLTLDGAQWYAGTNMYGEWYNLVQQQMELI